MSLLEKYYTKEHSMFRDAIRRYFSKEVTPNVEQWEADGIVPKSAWKKFGAQGFLCPWVPEEYGGLGADFLYSFILNEELSRTYCNGFFVPLHADIVVPYIYNLGNDAQKQRWLPGCVSGDIITALAMTEPDAGSDLAAIRTTAVRDGDNYIVNGQKTFISNGLNCGLVIIVVKTDPDADPPHEGITLVVVEDGTPGFEKGKLLKKIGLHSQDTVEMAFVDCIVPAKNVLGEVGQGFSYLMRQLQRERLVVAMGSQFSAEQALAVTVEYTKTREAFGQPLSKLQHISFELAKMATEVEIGRTFLESLVIEHMEGQDSVKKAAMAKYWICEMLNRVVGECVQLHGGYGYMEEYPIARMFRDARVQTIYAGTSEIMLLIIGRHMGL